jgi:carboxyl-terminal processing protease
MTEFFGNHRLLKVLSAGLLFFLTSCGVFNDDAQRAPDGSVVTGALPSESVRLFSFAYGQIVDKYVEPVQLDTLIGSALGNLQKIDPNFSVLRAGDQLQARERGAPVATGQAPRANDARRWAEYTVAAINNARTASEPLRMASNETIYRTVFDGATLSLDQYSKYLDPETAAEARAEREGFGGIGVTLEAVEGGEPRVTTVYPDTPAARAGFRVEDRLMEVEGQPTTGLPLQDVVRRLRGPVGRAVQIVVRHASDTELRPLTLSRALILAPTVAYRRDGNIAYIRLSGFNQGTTDQLKEALRRGMREIGPRIEGVILDLRGNLGGLLDQAISVSEVFLPEGPIVSTRGRYQASVQMSEAHGGGAGARIPLVVLINGASASASEIVAAALQDNGRAVLIGTNTYGKGSVQSVIQLPNDGELRLTWARFYAPSGYPLQDLGVNPTICTSGRSEGASAILTAAREGQMLTPAALLAWRAADHSKKDRLAELRRTCPVDQKENPFDLEVARSLLADRALYARAVRIPSQSNEAAR